MTPAYTLPLYDFLLSAFSRDELGRIIRWSYPDLHPRWPEGKSQAACAEWVVASVTIDRVPGFLDLLTRERYRRKAEVDAIRALLVVPEHVTSPDVDADKATALDLLPQPGRRLDSFTREGIDALPVGAAFVFGAGEDGGYPDLVRRDSGWFHGERGTRHPLDQHNGQPAFLGARTLTLPAGGPDYTMTAGRIARALAEAELRGIRKAATVNGSTPYPLLDVLRILCNVADHALDAHSCDHHGYEVWSEARHAGRECLRELTRLATIGGPVEALLNDDAVARARREGAEEMRAAAVAAAEDAYEDLHARGDSEEAMGASRAANLIRALPRPDFPIDNPRAWLFDGERAWLDACECPDLTVSVEVSVSLKECRGKRRKTRTPEQEERETVAGKLIDSRVSAMFSAGKMIAHIAQLRHDEHTPETTDER